MNRSILAATVVMLLMLTMAPAVEYVSPDKKISFTAPPAESFAANPKSTPPLVAMWSADATSTNVALITMANPGDAPLNQKGLEQGTLNQSGGSLVSSTETMISGIPTYTIVTSGNKAGMTLFYMQKILAFNGTAYKLMAVSPGDVSKDPQVMATFDSLKILDPSPVAPSGGRTGMDSHQLSVRIGQFAIVLLLIGIIATVAKRRLRPR